MADPAKLDSLFHPITWQWFNSAFAAPSPPQQRGWPAIASGQHTLILAPTGSGKTLAAFLWCIDDLLRRGLAMDRKRFEDNAGGVHTLYISPLKALNNDIHANLQVPLRGIRRQAGLIDSPAPEIRSAVRTGDTPPHLRQSMLRRPPHILITTPESLYLLLTSERGRGLFRGLRYLIVDEIHSLCGNKRGVHLSLSIERLMALVSSEPVRIGLSATQKPLERIAEYLGGARFGPDDAEPRPRPVTQIDCGGRKELDVRVISPVEKFSDLPEASVWPHVIETLYTLIREHRTTLVFVEMRAQSERIARQLNEYARRSSGDPEMILALAHHGSLSRRIRADVEGQLKRGEIPAVVATASLELGIDIGSIDLVVQLGSPKSLTSALQRIGRSGHLLSSRSAGVIVPLYRSDLDDAIAMALGVERGEIEETVIPQNCLDVLAQQILAEVAMREWAVEDLYRLVRCALPYRHLGRRSFESVLAMLSGRYAEAALRSLQPRITWDRATERLYPRRGARLSAVLNGGTIPDRAYYGVYLEGEGVRLGEVEEEFVFESRVGHVFFLGNNEWRITSIHKDRIVVAPLKAASPRAPFWKGEPRFRDFHTCARIAGFREDLAEKLDNDDAEAWLTGPCRADRAAALNLIHLAASQKAATSVLPSSRCVVVEWFRDESNEPQVIVHAPFGGRVNGAWALALAAAMEKSHRAQVQYTFDDDGIYLRIMDTVQPPPLQRLMRIPAAEIEKNLLAALSASPLFAVRFRQNATRALLLQRSYAGRRVPLWLQRLRAADLIQVVGDDPEFPILVETYRDCLHDLFDLDALRGVIEDIAGGRIEVHIVNTPHPSPMAAGLMFRFLAENLYQVDIQRTPAHAAEVSRELLSEVLFGEKLPALVTREMVREAESGWQYLSPQRKARGREDLYAIIEALGPISEQALRERASREPAPWLEHLQAEGRIVRGGDAQSGWMPAGRQKEEGDALRRGLLHYLGSHGPQAETDIAAALSAAAGPLREALEQLRREKKVIFGRLMAGESTPLWCDAGNYAVLHRRAVRERRAAAEPAGRRLFYRFTLAWHGVGEAGAGRADPLIRYSGLRMAPGFMENEILRARGYTGPAEHLSRAVSEGELYPCADPDGRAVCFMARGQGGLWMPRAELEERGKAVLENGDPSSAALYRFLEHNGASRFRDLSEGTELPAPILERALRDLAWRGLVSCDHYPSYTAILTAKKESGGARRGIRERLNRRGGQWFLTTAFPVQGREMSEEARVRSQARALLSRYGLLIKSWYRHETGVLPWYDLFQSLKKMEWSGEIRRGYFYRGLSGLQFAAQEAFELIEKLNLEEPGDGEGRPLWVSTADPALPLGGAVPWDLHALSGKPLAPVRSSANHMLILRSMPVAYAENYGSRIWRLSAEADEVLAAAVQSWLGLPAASRPRRKLVVLRIDGGAAASSPLAASFLRSGFERHGERLLCWPSALD